MRSTIRQDLEKFGVETISFPTPVRKMKIFEHGLFKHAAGHFNSWENDQEIEEDALRRFASADCSSKETVIDMDTFERLRQENPIVKSLIAEDDVGNRELEKEKLRRYSWEVEEEQQEVVKPKVQKQDNLKETPGSPVPMRFRKKF